MGSPPQREGVSEKTTMVSTEPQPCVEGVSLSGAMARLGGKPTSWSTVFSTPHQRTFDETEASARSVCCVRNILERFRNPVGQANIGLWGDFGIQVFDVSSGTPRSILRIKKKNQITNDGRAALLALMGSGGDASGDTARQENQIWSLAVGTNATTPTVTDNFTTMTSVWNEAFTFPAECAIVATPPNSYYLNISKTLGTTDAVGSTLAEAGILTRGDDDTPSSSTTKALYARQVHSPILKTSTMTIQYDWQLGITIA